MDDNRNFRLTDEQVKELQLCGIEDRGFPYTNMEIAMICLVLACLCSMNEQLKKESKNDCE